MIGTIDVLIPKMLKLDRAKQYELKEHKQKRSIDANNYYWQLITQISDIIREDKEKVHLEMLKQYGQVSSIMMLSSIDIRGFIRYYEADSKRLFNGKEYTVYRVYKGSSEMNSKEMSVLIDRVIEEAKELGIETLTPEELSKLRWGNNE